MSVLDKIKKAKERVQVELFDDNKKSGTDKKIAELQKTLSQYIRVGTSYFRNALRYDANGLPYETLERWTVEALNDDYKHLLHPINHYQPKNKAKYSISDFIEKYTGFCNVPDNINYQRAVNGCYNLYSPLLHQKKNFETQTQIKNTLALINHIFGNQVDIALDYLTILLRFPKQILPILCLVSSENETGKTTFLKLLKSIFQSNAVILTSGDFQNTFNSHYAYKSLIMIDENFIEMDKQKEKERVKQLGTANKIFMQLKGIDSKEIDYFGKLIMTSNMENNFMKIDKEDMRFWVVKVGILHSTNPTLLDSMIDEIPYFLDYLHKRTIIHPNVRRHWFANELLDTQARASVIESTRPIHEEILNTYFNEYFEQCDTSQIEISITDVLTENQKYAKYLHHRNVKQYFKDKGLVASERVVRYSYYSFLNGHTASINKTGKPYLLIK